MFLDECEVGYSGKIKKLEGNLKVRQRLLAMGLTPGIEILLVRKAPLGDPIEVEINSFFLTLRLEEAKTVRVRLLDAGPFHRHRGPHPNFGRGMKHGRHQWFRRFIHFSDSNHS